MAEASHSFLARHLPSRRLQKCVRTVQPDERARSSRRRGSAHPVCAVAALAEVKGKASRMPSLPFVKVAEQEDMKLALMLNVIDPSIGGVLIMGERGTGKSVAVRWANCNPAMSRLCHQLSALLLIIGQKLHQGIDEQVRAMVDLLPEIEVVAEDAFNSSPTDPKMMGPEALERFNRGEELPVARVKTPLVGDTTLMAQQSMQLSLH